MNAPEFPILDGSSRFFSEEIQKAGVVEQNAPKDYYIVKHKIEVKDEETGSSLIILPDDKFSVNVLISFNSPVLSNQFATLNDLSEFPTELAASRTFVFVREVEMLLQNNLIKVATSTTQSSSMTRKYRRRCLTTLPTSCLSRIRTYKT